MRILPATLLIIASLSAQDTYKASVDAWHARREASLAAENGWLTLIGRDWLKPGVNTLGSAPGSTVLLPAEVSPAFAGEFVFEGKAVRFKPAPQSGLLLNGKPAVEAVLKTDMDGAPDVISAGRIKLHLIRRGDRVAARIKDPEHPARKAFKGVPRYAVDPAWRVEATYTPHPKPITRAIPTVLGTTEPMTAPGVLSFKVGGKTYTLEPLLEDDGEPQLFIIFRDATSGRGTYAAGRFLYADMPKDGKVVLDFNRAINPPCAFTLFATCPLPPPQNVLKIPVPAGEKDPGLH